MSVGTGALAVTPSGEPGYSVRVSPAAALVIRALTEHGDEVELVDVADYVTPDGLRRKNDRRPALLEMVVPDEMVVSLRGEEQMRGKLMAVWIPAVVLDDLRRVIQTPAEAAAGGAPLIVTP